LPYSTVAGRGVICDSRSVVTDAAAGVTCDRWPAITTCPKENNGPASLKCEVRRGGEGEPDGKLGISSRRWEDIKKGQGLEMRGGHVEGRRRY